MGLKLHATLSQAKANKRKFMFMNFQLESRVEDG